MNRFEDIALQNMAGWCYLQEAREDAEHEAEYLVNMDQQEKELVDLIEKNIKEHYIDGRAEFQRVDSILTAMTHLEGIYTRRGYCQGFKEGIQFMHSLLK